MKFANVSNPAALGIEFETHYGATVQLAVPRPGGTGVLFAIKYGDAWTRTSLITDPERFGSIPTNFRELLAYAEAFAAAGPES